MIVCGFRTYWLLCLSSFLCFSIAKQGDRHHDVLKHDKFAGVSVFKRWSEFIPCFIPCLKATGGSVETKDFGKLIHFYCVITNSIISQLTGVLYGIYTCTLALRLANVIMAAGHFESARSSFGCYLSNGYNQAEEEPSK